jgi:hypothetical protein
LTSSSGAAQIAPLSRRSATGTRIATCYPFLRVSNPTSVFRLRTGLSFNAARYLKENLHRTRHTPAINGTDEGVGLKPPKFNPKIIAIAGVRAVFSNPELRLVTYCSRLMSGAMVGSMVYNHARS